MKWFDHPQLVGEDALVAGTSLVVLLLGFPGTGKFTIAEELRDQWATLGRDVRVVDNHYTANVVFGVLPLVDGYRSVRPEAWRHVDNVRSALWEAIIELASPETSFVFTSDISHADGPVHAGQYQQIAERRGSIFVPVRLLCRADELARRIVSPERRDRSKWLDADGVRRKHAAHTVLELDDPNGFSLDVSDIDPRAAASRIRAHVERLI